MVRYSLEASFGEFDPKRLNFLSGKLFYELFFLLDMPANTTHPCFTQPHDPNVKIWRYMDFTKFASMLEESGLFFSRSDMLGDPFEGSTSKLNADNNTRFKIYADDIKKKNVTTEGLLAATKMLASLKKWSRQWMMINCWHMNEHESAAMWKLYTKSNESICIQSTYSKLTNLLPERVYVGMVQYIDYSREWMDEGNAFTPYLHKRKSFGHENEIRAIHDYSPNIPLPMNSGEVPPESGVWHRVDLNELIENIYISPSSPSWFKDLVQKVINRYDLNVNVIKSSLDEEPFF